MQLGLTQAIVFFDPLALFFVVFGSLLLAGAQEGWHSVVRAIAASPAIFRSGHLKDAELARSAAIRVARMVERRGLSCADRVKVDPPFVRAIIGELANHTNPASFRDWANTNVEERQTRHSFAARYWSTVAEVAPALGMIGTVIGLVLMFGQVEDATAIGHAMAIAMLTTLYGLLLSNVVAGPISVRLIRASEHELTWQRDLADRLIQLVEHEYANEKPEIAPILVNRGLDQCA